MALNSTSLLLPTHGRVLIGAVGTAQPTQAQVDAFVTSDTEITGFSLIGYTSSDTLPTFDVDGGDTTAYSTWEADSVKTATEAITDTVVVNVSTIDGVTLPLFYGGGTVVDGAFTLPDSPTAQSRALLVIFIDPDVNVGFYAYKAQAIRNDAIGMGTDQLTELPIGFTLVKDGTNPKGVWISPAIEA